ncbi:MAG: hypothetical protein DWQ04_09575 [Chloroflexi bacterium]|nr:MAG: hypothetical protein DWQ04_09575 [Chloroflexota bacterium]
MGTVKYVGEVNGRSITVNFAIRTRNRYVTANISYRNYQGLVMDITAKTSVQTRLAVLPQPRMLAGLGNFIHKLQKKMPVLDLGEAYAPFRAWADDADWALSYLGSSERNFHKRIVFGFVKETAQIFFLFRQWIC